MTSLINYSEYKSLYKQSIEQPELFWQDVARRYVIWEQDFTQVYSGDSKSFSKFNSNNTWFKNGKLNACYNCLDKNLEKNSNKIAYYWQGDNLDEQESITYGDLYKKVCKFSNVLLSLGINTGDRVCLYLPLSINAIVAMLACARLGVIHSVVFAGFSGNSLAERILDAECKLLITTSYTKRGGKEINLEQNIDQACHILNNKNYDLKIIELDNFYYKNKNTKYLDYAQLELKLSEPESEHCAPVFVDADHPLFILYTSGSTGKPKGVVHSTAGYLMHVIYSFNQIFYINNQDIYWCTADIGWITGHSYVVYGPLSNGVSSVIFSGTPNYPNYDIFWRIIDKYSVSIFYTAPTAIRALMREGDEYLSHSSRQSLRLLGSVGEPINPEAWQWYYKAVGNSRCPIIDTWWQTETGADLLAPIADIGEYKPGCAMLPFYGINLGLLDSQHNIIQGAGEGELVIVSPWPGMLQTVYNQPERYLNTYFKVFQNFFYTGDLAKRDEDGHYWILGRSDDVINISGHRIGTAEVESALVAYDSVAEAAIIAMPDPIKGQGMWAYVVLKNSQNNQGESDLEKVLRDYVKSTIGTIAIVDKIIFVQNLPKTRSGKIMRRILKKIAMGETQDLGDTSTLLDESILKDIVAQTNLKINPEINPVYKKLKFKARRGMLELDLILQNYLKTSFANMSSQDKQDFEELMSLSDPELWDILVINKKTDYCSKLENIIKAILANLTNAEKQ